MSRFEEEIERAITAGEFPGAALLVSRKGEICYQKVFGAATLLPERESMTETTLFDIASLTKPVATTTLTLLARQEKKLSFDTAVVKHLPELKGEDKERITVRHLLKHTSGLPAWKPYFEEVKKNCPDLLGKRDCVSVYVDMISQEPLVVPVAYQRIYSDLGFILLGIYLERLYGQPLDQMFQERVAAPLCLKDTFFIPNDQPPADRHRFAATENSGWRKRLLRGEVHDDNAFALGGVAGHAGLFSSPNDLHLFLTEIEKGYRGQSTLLTQEVVQEFIGPKVKFKLGWDIPDPTDSQAGSHFSRNTIGHLGYTGCSFWTDLDNDFHIIFLTNRVHPDANNEAIKQVRPRLHDLVYEELIAS